MYIALLAFLQSSLILNLNCLLWDITYCPKIGVRLTHIKSTIFVNKAGLVFHFSTTIVFFFFFFFFFFFWFFFFLFFFFFWCYQLVSIYCNILEAYQGSFSSQSWFQTQGQGRQQKANYLGLIFIFFWLTKGFIKYLI